MIRTQQEDHIVHEDAAAGVRCEEGDKERESPERHHEQKPLPNKAEINKKLPPLPPIHQT